MICVTHYQVEAMTMADKIVVLNVGRVAPVGAPVDLDEDPADLFVAGFVGSPRMKLLLDHVHPPGHVPTHILRDVVRDEEGPVRFNKGHHEHPTGTVAIGPKLSLIHI